MNPDILKKAVDLADGWQWATYSDDVRIELELADGAYWYDDADTPVTPEDMPKVLKDALAAQLRRQVNATGKYAVHIEPHMVIICSIADDGSHHRVTEYVADDGDETENSITAIVESKVLEKNDERCHTARTATTTVT